MKNAKEQEKVLNEMKVHMEDINDAEADREKLIKMSESLDNNFVSFVKKADFEKDMTQVSSLISKTNTLKRRSEESKQDAKKLGEAVELLEMKQRKLGYY